MPNDAMRTKDFAVEGIEVKADDRYPGGVISGYASVFGNVDLHGEIVRPGAFKKTLGEIGAKGVMLLDNHRFHDGSRAAIGRTAPIPKV